MPNEADRMARAGNYVLGLMNEAERERAERDLERDATFRDAVLSVAQRMRLIGAGAARNNGEPDERWDLVSARLGELPQMRGIVPMVASASPSGPKGAGRGAARLPAWPAAPAMPLRRSRLIALAVAVAFGLGYTAGLSTSGMLSAPAPDLTAAPDQR